MRNRHGRLAKEVAYQLCRIIPAGIFKIEETQTAGIVPQSVVKAEIGGRDADCFGSKTLVFREGEPGLFVAYLDSPVNDAVLEWFFAQVTPLLAEEGIVAEISGESQAGLAGVLWGAQYGTINSTAGTGYELQVVSAVVVGGVAIFGGSGSPVGAAIGALLLGTINVALDVLGISDFWDQAIAGFLLLVAITLDRLISVRLAAALRKRSARDGT